MDPIDKEIIELQRKINKHKLKYHLIQSLIEHSKLTNHKNFYWIQKLHFSVSLLLELPQQTSCTIANKLSQISITTNPTEIENQFRQYFLERSDLLKYFSTNERSIGEYYRSRNAELKDMKTEIERFPVEISNCNGKCAELVKELSTNLSQLMHRMKDSVNRIDRVESESAVALLQTCANKCGQILAKTRRNVYLHGPSRSYLLAQLNDKRAIISEQLQEISSLENQLREYKENDSHEFQEIIKRHNNIRKEIDNRRWGIDEFGLG